VTHPGEALQQGTSQREWRRWVLIVIVLGLMSVSIGGQVDSIGTKLAPVFAYVFAIGNDAAAILALDAALRAERGSSIRKWAWLAILLAAGTGGVLNAWHATVERTVVPGGGHELPPLPGEFGLLVGLEPIALILVLSHLVGLVLTDRQARPAGDAGPRQAPAAADRQTAGATDRQATTVVVTASEAGDRRTASPAPARTPGAAPAGAAGDRATAGTPPRRPAPVARGSLHAVPAVRQGWMTEDLIARIVASMAVAQRQGETYGRPRLMREHGLNNHRARTLLDHIAEHQLLRETA